MNAFAVMKKLLVVYTGHSSNTVPVTPAQQRSWPEQAADMKSEGLKLLLEMQTDICETSLCVNPVLQRFRLSRCQSDVLCAAACLQICMHTMCFGTMLL